MGGVMFILAVTFVCLTVGFEGMLQGNFVHIFVLLFAWVFGLIGFLDDWEKLKKKEKHMESYSATMEAVPKGFPALMRAAKIQKKAANVHSPFNLEEQAISLVGTDIYEKLIKGYTEKQWGRDCKDLPSFIIKRLPVRFTYDNNYFNALYQGVPIGGYTEMVNKMLDGIEVNLNVDYLEDRDLWNNIAQTVVYTGPIDAFYKYCFGALQYRSVRFETELLDIPNYQGNAAVNYTDSETPWTRIIEHKWFEFGKNEKGEDIPRTVISRELSSEWKLGDEPYYPVNDDFNNSLYFKYKELSDKERNIIFGGRLAEYKYYDMDAVIASALEKSNSVIKTVQIC